MLELVIPPVEVLDRLVGVAGGRGAAEAHRRLAEVRGWLDDDLAGVESMLAALDTGAAGRLPGACARHLLDLSGKRLRPLCVALASRCGAGFSAAARELAVAVELVHSATLLHDDVVDLGERRRGREAARLVYGNAASIFGGDWLLVEALARIRRVGVEDLLERMLDVLREMIAGEALQLERRGQPPTSTSAADYFRVVEGKTAALFRWAMYAGACVAGVDAAGCVALEAYGRSLGVAFQLADDLLDLTGDPARAGKSLRADLEEGNVTYPLLLALERDPSLRVHLAARRVEPVLAALAGSGALDESRLLAHRLAAAAAAHLDPLPPTRARGALITLALAAVEREV